MEKQLKEVKEMQTRLLGRIIGMMIGEVFCIVCSAYLCSTGTILGWTLGLFMIFSACITMSDVMKYIRAYRIGQKTIKLAEFIVSVKQRIEEAEPVKLDDLDKWDEN